MLPTAATSPEDFIVYLENLIAERKQDQTSNSYTATLLRGGINGIAQKLGEEAIELVIEAKDDNEKLFLNEAADLLFHFLVLLSAKGKTCSDVIEVLRERDNGDTTFFVPPSLGCGGQA